ncbi:MAG TPA: N-acetylmuramoyl-L-alanine amidase [Saprospiraceae bacterium]|nr:N-acetylmuramoyl-L-alanine amidase [Saprospiraceae bacterium]
MNIYLHITTFANVTHMVKGMKVWNGSKTSMSGILSTTVLVLTLSFAFSISLEAQVPYKIRKVVIDPGHGGKDPGCNGHHSREKEVALSIGLDLGKKLKAQYPDIQVIYTRDTDVFIPLNERAAIANRNKADLFISIHCNYISVRNRATGSETYVLGLHRAEDNLDVAKRENSAILLEDNYEKTYEGFDPYSPEGHIILSMFQNAHLEQSILFATHVESAFKKLSRLPSRGVKQAGFLVLRETTMPSVLIETGFLSTDTDENYLMKKENQQEMASTILKAFSNYKKEVEEYQEPDNSANTPQKATNGQATNVDDAKAPTSTKGSLEVAYRIQIAASSKSTIDARYHNIDDLEVIKEGEMYKFLVGYFSSAEAARPRLSALKANGFDGAFIVAYKDGQRIKA